MIRGSKFAVSGKLLMMQSAYDIKDGDTGAVLATAVQPKPSPIQVMIGMVMGGDMVAKTVEVRDPKDNLLFSIRRTGWFVQKVEVLDGEDKPLARYKAKMMSGFNVVDPEGKQLVEIKGKMFSGEYKFVTADGKAIGSSSRTWGGMAKSMIGGSGDYGIQIEPAYAKDDNMKVIVLGAAIAVDTMFPKPGAKVGGMNLGGK